MSKLSGLAKLNHGNLEKVCGVISVMRRHKTIQCGYMSYTLYTAHNNPLKYVHTHCQNNLSQREWHKTIYYQVS